MLPYNDRTTDSSQGTPVTLTIGSINQTTRLAHTRLLGTLIDYSTGEPISDASSYIYVYNTSYVGVGYITTDANGLYTATFSTLAITGPLKLRFPDVPNYADQYYERSPSLDGAQSVSLHWGDNTLPVRLART